MFSRRKAGKKVEFVICAFTLCADVLEGVLQFGTRRKLLKLQCAGRQFHCVIVNRFVERPFLVLDRLRTVFEESIFRSQDDLEFDPEAGAEKFKEILSAPGVPVATDYMVSQISFL